MKRCPNCSRVYSDMVTVCPVCQTNLNANPIGASTQNQSNYTVPTVSQPVQTATGTQQSTQDKGNWFWVLPGLLMPLAGVIIWLCLRKNHPANAKIASTGALIGFFLNIALRYVL